MSNNEFMTWESEVNEQALADAPKGFIVHEESERDFVITELNKENVKKETSKYFKGNMAQLTLDVEGAKVWERIILHNDFAGKIQGLWDGCGLAKLHPSERWSQVLGAKGRVKIKKESYVDQKSGETKFKNTVHYFLKKTDTPVAPQQATTQAPQANPWDEAPKPPQDDLPF